MIARLRQLIRGRAESPQARRVVPLGDYDKAITAELARVPKRVQMAFAAATAERLYPAYNSYLAASFA